MANAYAELLTKDGLKKVKVLKNPSLEFQETSEHTINAVTKDQTIVTNVQIDFQ